MVYFVDTNIFIRILVKEDERSFHECFQFFQRAYSGKIKIITSSLVLAEVHWVLSSFYRFEKDKTIEALQNILNTRVRVKDGSNVSFALEMFRNTNVKLTDAFIASHPLIEKRRATIVSYDKDFDKLGIPRKEPGEIIKKRKGMVY